MQPYNDSSAEDQLSGNIKASIERHEGYKLTNDEKQMKVSCISTVLLALETIIVLAYHQINFITVASPPMLDMGNNRRMS